MPAESVHQATPNRDVLSPSTVRKGNPRASGGGECAPHPGRGERAESEERREKRGGSSGGSEQSRGVCNVLGISRTKTIW